MKKVITLFTILSLSSISLCYSQFYINAAFGFQNSTQLTADHSETLTQHFTDELGAKISCIFPRFKEWQNSALELQVGGMMTDRIGIKPDGSPFKNEVISVPVFLNARQPRMKENGTILWEAVLGLGYFQDVVLDSDYSDSVILPKGGIVTNWGISFYFDEFLKMDLNFYNMRPWGESEISDSNPPPFKIGGLTIALSSNLNNLLKQ